jgi:hypothetical protein
MESYDKAIEFKPDKHVAFYDPETLEVLRGEVLAHALNAQDVYAAMPIAQGRGVAFEFFGHIPENVAFIL